MTKHVEVPSLQFVAKAVDIPVVEQRQITVADKQREVVHVLVVQFVEVSQVQVIGNTVESPHVQIVEKVVGSSEIPTAQGYQK